MLKTMIGAIGCLAMLLVASAAPAQTGTGAASGTAPGAPSGAAAAPNTPFAPIAIVNDSAITGFDLIQREKLMVALGAQAPSKEALRNAAMNQLIEDRLKVQEAKRGGLSVSKDELAQGIAETAKKLGMTVPQMRATLKKAGVTDQALTDMVDAGLLWRDMIRSRYASRIDPGEAEIDAEINLMKERATTSYHIAEIGLPLTERGRSEAQTRALAARLSESLNKGGDFAAAARKYSRAASAAQGGDIGWIAADKMPPAMAAVVADMKPGQVSPAIPVRGGVSILKVIDKKTQSAATIDANDPKLRDQVRQKLQNEQIDRLAQGLLQELRRDALIETR